MTTQRPSDQWFMVLQASAASRFGPERTAVLADELRHMAEAIARLLAEPLEFHDDPPADFPLERGDGS
ncbi:MAG: hypothetical protein NZL87_04305 [Thermomicrobium sp.]|nr:hypothetical protein [Thermomicrobium sp.]